MDLTSLDTIKYLAKTNGFHPVKSSGQNFLVSEKVLSQIIKTAGLKKTDQVMEIGPGFGTLTVRLLDTGAKVSSFEIDKKLIRYLKRYEGLYPNFKLYDSNVLDGWPIINKEFKDLDYKLVSNLPYNITSIVLRNFTENIPRPSEMVLMVQKEVAERVISKPGQMSILAVAVQFYGSPEKIIDVPPESFWPQPEVNSSILRITEIGQDINGFQKKLLPYKTEDFFRTVKIGFAARRKQLHNNLANGFNVSSKKTTNILNKIGIKPTIRAQDLKIEDWINITRHFI